MFSLLITTGKTNAFKINIHIVTDKIAGTCQRRYIYRNVINLSTLAAYKMRMRHILRRVISCRVRRYVDVIDMPFSANNLTVLNTVVLDNVGLFR